MIFNSVPNITDCLIVAAGVIAISLIGGLIAWFIMTNDDDNF